jgi:acetyl-CoA decarbonylase/synthase complex subunit gamma
MPKKNSSPSCGCANQVKKQASPCCGPTTDRAIRYRPVESAAVLKTGTARVTRVPSRWNLADRAGACLARLGFNRMNYAVAPGLYAVGSPGRKSPVLVSANYKLSFDVLRRAAEGLDAWVLVVDTKGVNVWCSAGKGTFSAEETARMVRKTGLEKIVSHRLLVLPQLSAPGVAAHRIHGLCGFKAVFGPVEASHIRQFLENRMTAPQEHRLINFGLKDRMAVAWLEISTAVQWLFLIFAARVILGLFFNDMSLTASLASAAPFLISLVTGLAAGAVAVPAALPFLPGRAFSAKGAFAGGILGAGVFAILVALFAFPPLKGIGYTLISASVSAYLALNFTGSSTFTSLSGVKREVRIALPAIIGALIAGVALT